MPSSKRVRVAASAAPCVLAALVVGGVYLGVRERLPDPIATHFPGSGAPDGFGSGGGFVGVAVGVLLGMGVLMGALGGFQQAGAARWIPPLSWAAAGLTGSVMVSALVVNSGVADAHDVRMPVWHLGIGCAVAVAAGCAGWLIARGWPGGPVGRGVGPAGRLTLGETESAVWVRGTGSWQLGLIGGVLVVGGVATVAPLGWIPCTVLVPAGLSCLVFSRLQVAAGPRGLSVSVLGLPWARVRVPLDGMASATARQVSAIGDFGGWGYRIRPGASGVILRSGEALVVRRRGRDGGEDGREFAVTVQDAATAAALLTSLIDNSRTTHGTSSTSG
ncbi:hypothetical protein AB0J38_43000 [Streptomyces sp. NPDC050095]|uniref:hypothetical protein n=1 Tax=unclassified Streptomyces TaxID=2593676 RepID=UPI003413235B